MAGVLHACRLLDYEGGEQMMHLRSDIIHVFVCFRLFSGTLLCTIRYPWVRYRRFHCQHRGVTRSPMPSCTSDALYCGFCIPYPLPLLDAYSAATPALQKSTALTHFTTLQYPVEPPTQIPTKFIPTPSLPALHSQPFVESPDMSALTTNITNTRPTPVNPHPVHPLPSSPPSPP